MANISQVASQRSPREVYGSGAERSKDGKRDAASIQVLDPVSGLGQHISVEYESAQTERRPRVSSRCCYTCSSVAS